MDPVIAQKVAEWLERDERPLWGGRPAGGVLLHAGDVFLIPFSILWFGFAVFWEVGVVNSNAPPFFALFGAPFIVIGLYFVFGRFAWDAFRRARTVYAVTSRRVIILSEVWRGNIQFVDLRNLEQIRIRAARHGRGTLVLGQEPPWWASFGAWPGGRESVPTLEAIDGAKDVLDTIRRAQRGLREPGEMAPARS